MYLYANMNENASLFEDWEDCSYELERLDGTRIPEHIAIMMDGNRRWACSHNLPTSMGYVAGAKALTNIVKASSSIGVKTVTAYAFSTENWNRPQNEVESLMHLFKTYLVKERLPMKADGVRFDTIGDLSKLPAELQEEIASTKEFTSDCNTINLVLALNYGSRNEMFRAFHSLIGDIETGALSKDELSEEKISEYLDTYKYEDPDLLIRTSGEFRLSNFLLWQISYAEVYVTKTYWPDFTEKSLLQAIIDYQNRTRRHGAL